MTHNERQKIYYKKNREQILINGQKRRAAAKLNSEYVKYHFKGISINKIFKCWRYAGYKSCKECNCTKKECEKYLETL